MKSISFSKIVFFTFFISLLFLKFSCKQKRTLTNYSGTPFEDEQYDDGAQKIPGRLQFEYYDTGGEGIAYHDLDSVNSGSGVLNVSDEGYLNEFRKNEGVDISYTMFEKPAIDNSSYNFVEPKENDLYVGWTDPGEWIKYTIDVSEKGTYSLGLMYTAYKDAKISLAINDQLVIKNISIPCTFVTEDPVNWRQWHHWNYLNDIPLLNLEEGLQTFTIHMVEAGNMNYNYMDFKLVD